MPGNITIDADQREKLRKMALDARNQSYSPYSKFRVGAAILTSDGEYVLGANVENASYGASICAERTAAVTAIYSGKKSFKAVAVASDLNEACSPCGICRQFLREFTPLDAPVILVTESGENEVDTTLGDLLPLSFGPEHLQ